MSAAPLFLAVNIAATLAMIVSPVRLATSCRNRSSVCIVLKTFLGAVDAGLPVSFASNVKLLGC